MDVLFLLDLFFHHVVDAAAVRRRRSDDAGDVHVDAGLQEGEEVVRGDTRVQELLLLLDALWDMAILDRDNKGGDMAQQWHQEAWAVVQQDGALAVMVVHLVEG